ncbi:biopolymer transporter ExbD, partial [Akkermansiaceae bacterium]|nr:biopolymer transporter ExbD [Akkermansiaceae bacterium]
DAEISMSPLIDCVFLLLIFFLVATMSKKANKDVDIRLPESRSAVKRLATDEQLVIGIDLKGNVFLEGMPASIMVLHDALRSEALANPNRQVRIDADAEAPLANVVEVVDICQFNHLDDVVLRTYDENYNR